VDAQRSWIDRLSGLLVLAMFTVGVVAVAAVTWRLIPNHAVALGAIVVLVPLFLWVSLRTTESVRRYAQTERRCKREAFLAVTGLTIPRSPAMSSAPPHV
jgi:hypothetical protein